MIYFKFRHQKIDNLMHVNVYSKNGAANWTFNGKLTFTIEEWDAFQNSMIAPHILFERAPV